MQALQVGPEASFTAKNGVVVVFTENNCIGVMAPDQVEDRVLRIEVYHRGKLVRHDFFNAAEPYRDHLPYDLKECEAVVLDEAGNILCGHGNQPQGVHFQPWMVQQGEQAHVTENYVSVPPALHLTDAAGARWSLGVIGQTAHKEQSPKGEFAFAVLRDGVTMHEIASRMELRNGVVRIFTRHGWKRWLGREFS